MCLQMNQSICFLSTLDMADCHRMVVTVLKTHISKAKPKEIIYRSYKNFNKTTFENELKKQLSNMQDITYKNFENIF